jgi:predicted unusual protein kinase regulating ubiquinone biosynthesis (AarF/ABC1/UbiB family)
MKLEGEFATLLTNIVVMEAIAKDVDPNIELIKCAIPYFNFSEKVKYDSKPMIQDQFEQI